MKRELNLLPPDRRRLVRRQSAYAAIENIIATVNIGLGISAGAAIVMIILLLVLVFGLRMAAGQELDASIDEYQALVDEVASQNEALRLMEQVSKERTIISEILPDLVDTMPPGTIISKLSAVTEGVGRISVSGRAVSRNALIVWGDRLKAVEWIDSIDAPAQNLIERSNPVYQIQLTLKPPV